MRYPALTVLVSLVLLLAGCEATPQGSNKTPTPIPTLQAPVVSGNTTSQKALSIARVVSWQNQDMFVVTDAELSTRGITVMNFKADTGEFLGFGTLGGSGSPILVYTMFVTKTLEEVNDEATGPVVQSRLAEGLQKLFELNAATFARESPEFLAVVAVLVYPRGQSFFFVSTHADLIAEYSKASPNWNAFLEDRVWDGLNAVVRGDM